MCASGSWILGLSGCPCVTTFWNKLGFYSCSRSPVTRSALSPPMSALSHGRRLGCYQPHGRATAACGTKVPCAGRLRALISKPGQRELHGGVVKGQNHRTRRRDAG